MATQKITFNPENRDEFLEIRNHLHAEKRLGGSDIGNAAGVNPYKSRLRFYNEMIGAVKPKDISDKISVRHGNLLEETCAKCFEMASGKKVHRVNAVQISEDAPHLFASIDRKVENEEAGLECKTARAERLPEFSNGRIPASYAMQVKAYMKVTGYRTWYVYVFIGNVAEPSYIFTMDDIEKPEWCDTIIKVTQDELDECERIAANWFDLIDKGTPPEFDGCSDEVDFIKEIHPESTDLEVINLKLVTEEDLAALETLKASIKDLENKASAIENAIKEEMGSHAEGMIGEHKVTWKNNKASTKVDWKAAAEDAKVSEEIIAKFTEVKPGNRVLRIK